MRKFRLTLTLGVLSVLLFAPSCNRSSSGGTAQVLALAAVMAWSNPLAMYLVHRTGAFPQRIETLRLKHTGQIGDVEFDLADPSGTLAATPAAGVIRPGEEILVQVVVTALVAYTAATLVLNLIYANGLRPSDRIQASLPFALVPPALYVVGLLSGFDPTLTALFWTALSLRAVGVAVQHSSPGSLRNRIPWLRHTEIAAMGIMLFALTQAILEENFLRNRNAMDAGSSLVNVNFPPGEGPLGYTIHPDQEEDLVAGDIYVLHLTMDGPVPVKDPEAKNLYTYAFVFDSDGDPANDWKADPAFPNDFWKDTDRWYQVLYSARDGWSLRVGQVGAGNNVTGVPSAARVILIGDTVVLVVPKSEIPGPDAKWRGTSFVHQGDFGINPPYTWSGDVEPPVNEPLLPVR